jgi:DnaJ-class molecular chaperone
MTITKAINIMQLSNRFDFGKLTKQYKKLLFKFHPDHGGSNKEFIELKKAYELLWAYLKWSSLHRSKELYDELEMLYTKNTNGNKRG